MGRLLYVDCFSGISGDKTLGAFVDLGLPIEDLRRELSRMPLEGWAIEAVAVERNWMRGTQVKVEVTGDQGHRGRKEIHGVIGGSTLPDEVKDLSLRIFELILHEEARIHGISVDEVHLHEVGAVDALVDVVGSAIAVGLLGRARIVASPVNVGSGTAAALHGTLPVPAPATAEILRGVPIYGKGPEFELTTPTGAAIIATLAQGFGPVPPMTVERLGYGAGARDFPGFPNLLRLMWGHEAEPRHGAGDAGCGTMVLETNVDDCSPQVLAHAMERMFEAGALDVFFQPVQMKKGRPGVLVTAIVAPERMDAVAQAVFRETTSIGLRYGAVDRLTLERRMEQVATPWGPVAIKVSSWKGEEMQATPEFEDARKRSEEAGVPVARVIEEALAAYRRGRAQGA